MIDHQPLSTYPFASFLIAVAMDPTHRCLLLRGEHILVRFSDARTKISAEFSGG